MQQSKQVTLNNSQAIIKLVNANVCYNLWPRGNGKTEGGSGPRIIHISEVMPRSQMIFASDTFERIESVLIPNVMSFISREMGLVEGENFVVFKKPPEHWIKPYIVPRKFERVVSFDNGFCIVCAATFKDGSFNGINAQSAIIDELKYCREDRLKSQMFKALRGLNNIYGHLPEYRSVWGFTDKYEGDIKWILKLRDAQNDKLIKAIITQQLQILQWETKKLNATNDSTKYFYQTKIISLQNKLDAIRKELIYVRDAQPFENIDILGEKFYRDAKRDCKTIHEYNIAILNQDPTKVENTFYPNLTKDVMYSSVSDVDANKPLAIAMDYQWRIIPIVVGQYNDLVNGELNFKIVSSMHVLYPLGLEEAVDLFCDTYQQHKYKVVQYVYDKTAIGKDPSRGTFRDIVYNRFVSKGWRVVKIYIGEPEQHDSKYEYFLKLFLLNPKLLLFNELNAHYLINAMYQAGTKIGTKGTTQKEKKYEKDLNFPAEETTDYTDAFDQLAIAALKLNKISKVGVSSFSPNIIKLS